MKIVFKLPQAIGEAGTSTTKWRTRGLVRIWQRRHLPINDIIEQMVGQ